MPSRQDQLHSYQFSVQRVVAALVMRETDPAQSPFRRVAGATMAGAIVAVLALAGAAVYGIFAGGSGDWQTEGQVIIDKDSGARYVYYKGDRKLHPVINYTSALLIADAARPQVVTWSRSAIDKATFGAPMGIPGAPDSLPDAKHLARPPWTLCSQGAGDASGGSGAANPQSVLFVGGAAEVGQPLVPARAASPGEGILVSTPDGRRYLVYDNRRHQLVQPDLVLQAFVWSTKPIVPVSPALINALPAGPDLKPLSIEGRGARSSALPGGRVGQVYKRANAGGAVQHAVVLADGLAEITEAEADLLLADPETPLGPRGRDNELPGNSQVAPSRTRLAGSPPFAVPPTIRLTAGPVCASISDGKGASKVLVDAKLPDQSGAVTTQARTGSGALLADRIVVSGRGALVEAVASPGARSGALSIVSELGIRYPLASRDLVTKLGYAGVTPTAMPAELVVLLPVGPALDPAEARQRAGS
ncbi:type VII secretion protein EccB [Planosporangium flavigriseum]|uniref:Type VII secretion protein EccB n=1 Tax=Planosporangium flavigriseum TaxID=373681 RepID=A0A8J3LIE6_9ACTN|nr:type VII secretion protein EccB [Planosporangium flavigriseum]NJC64314.1 type VII secretion protein EccB [Planosporangium flavigriseum]GIG73838.1 type VII secretion protein EccB [Planosporangium flavigriseum]